MSGKQPGTSIADPVIVEADNEWDGASEVYRELERRFGTRGRDWELSMQRLNVVNDRHYDEMVVEVGGEMRTVHFDIESFYGKPDDASDPDDEASEKEAIEFVSALIAQHNRWTSLARRRGSRAAVILSRVWTYVCGMRRGPGT